MALSTFVKISNVSNLSDARYCAGMGVDQIGINLNPTDADSLPIDNFIELKGWIAGVSFVGEFGATSFEEIRSIQQKVPLDMIEISTINIVENVHILGKPISVSLDIWNQPLLNELKSHLSYLDELASQVVINCSNPLLYNDISQAIQFYNGPIRLIKGFDVTMETIQSPTNFKGIQLHGSQEDKPGFKDYGVMMDLLEALEVE